MQAQGSNGFDVKSIAVSGASVGQELAGVSWDPKCQSYIARIFWAGKHRHIGRYPDPVTAARAFDKASVYLYGEAAKTNFGIEAALQDATMVSESIVKTGKAVGKQTAANRQHGMPGHAQGWPGSAAGGVQFRSTTPTLAAAAAAASQTHAAAACQTMPQQVQQQQQQLRWAMPSGVEALLPQSTAPVLPPALHSQALQQQLLLLQQQQQQQQQQRLQQQEQLLLQGQHPAQHAGIGQAFGTGNNRTTVAVMTMHPTGCHNSSAQLAQHGHSTMLLHPQQQQLLLLPLAGAAGAATAGAATAGAQSTMQGGYSQQQASILSRMAAMQLQSSGQVPNSYVQGPAPTQFPLLQAPPVPPPVQAVNLPFAVAASVTATGLYASTAMQQAAVDMLPVQGGLAGPELVLVQRQQHQPQLQVQLQLSPRQYQY